MKDEIEIEGIVDIRNGSFIVQYFQNNPENIHLK